MRAPVACVALLASFSLTAMASEGVELSVKSRTMAADGEPAREAQAPFRHARDPMPELVLRDEQERRGPLGGCENAAGSVCYDAGSGKIVYRGAREYMPKLDGLTAESISLRRGRVTLKYSF
jgi:hypothetical protein